MEKLEHSYTIQKNKVVESLEKETWKFFKMTRHRFTTVSKDYNPTIEL